MNLKRPSKLLLALMTLTLLLHAFAPAGAALAATLASPHGQGGPVLNPGEGWAGPIAGASSDPGKLTLESSSGSGTNPTQQDYLTIYNQAKSLLNSGVDFRARQLQRLDPATCVQDRNNPNSCSFSVTGITNNYLDFNNGRLYWRYCADYDEAFVGVGSVAQEVDDPGNKLKIDPFGYCPTWNALDADQKTRRVAGGDLQNGQPVAIDIRNTLVDAIRIFAVLAVAEPANMALPGIDEVRLLPSGELAPGADGQPDLARNVGVFNMLKATREVANAHMIFGNEFMVKALRFPFSVNDLSSQSIVETEQKQLLRAVRQYALATEILLFTLNYELGGATPSYIADHFTAQEFQLFAAASEQTVTALTEVAKRDRLLGADVQVGDKAAIQRLNASFLDQYLAGGALACQATGLGKDDPATPNVDESMLNFLTNGGYEIINNLRRLVQQTESIRAGLNPFGYEDSFVPLKSFPELLQLTCGGSVACNQNGGLLNSALLAGNDLRDSQRTFDEKYDQLISELTDLQYDYDRDLTEICGPSQDKDGDGLLDFDTCGPQDKNGDGFFDYDPNVGGLMAQNFWDIDAANNRASLARQRVKHIAEQIQIEQERAGKIISVTLEAGRVISANILAIGVINATTTTTLDALSNEDKGYFDAYIGGYYKNAFKTDMSANPIDCILGGCDFEVSQSFGVEGRAGGGYQHNTSHIGTTQTVYDPAQNDIANYEGLNALQEALKDATIEGANSAAQIRQLLLEAVELQKEFEIATTELNGAITEHNFLVDKYLLLLTQRTGARDYIQQESPLAKPYFRLFRDGAALEAARTLDQAAQAAYLTAKAYEYDTLSRISYLHELFRVRNASNLRAFLDKLATDYQALPQEQFSKRTYRLSLAQDIFGLTQGNLNPTGNLTQNEVEALRTQEFQAILRNARITNSNRQVDKLALVFSTGIDHPKFLSGVFNNRIARISSNDPGCASGCRGVWLNLVTEQPIADFQGDLPQIKLSHGGHATYRNGLLQDVSYDPGPAVMIGRSLPPGFGGDTRAALITTHLNLPLDANPDPNKQEDRFYNLSIATNQWILEIDLTNPTENTKLDLSKLKDIEIRMDTTYVTPSQNQQVVAASNRALDAQEAGEAVMAEDQALLAAYAQAQAVQAQAKLRAAAQQPAPAEQLGFTGPQAEEAQYFGTIVITQPVGLGIIDIGFTLDIASNGAVTGRLCDGCGPLYNTPANVTGLYNPATKALTFQADPLPRAIGNRLAQRIISFQGFITDEGDIKGAYLETLSGYTARSCITSGNFRVTPLTRQSTPPGATPNRSPTAQDDSFKVTPDSNNNSLNVLANDSDADGNPLKITAVGNAVNGIATTDGNTLIYTPKAGFAGTEVFVYTISDGRAFAVATVTVGVTQPGVNVPPAAVGDTMVTERGVPVTLNVIANDGDADGDDLTVTAVSIPQNGTATTDGKSITYTPNAGFVGIDTLTYTISDGKGGTAAGSVTVMVNGPGGPNQAPTAANDSVGTTPGAAVTINVLGNDSDPNGDALLITIDSQPAHGTAVVQNGQILYTPAVGYTGTDSFTYIVSDGKGGTAKATVTITISASGQPAANPLYLPLIYR